MNDLLAALIVALTGLPALGIAATRAASGCAGR